MSLTPQKIIVGSSLAIASFAFTFYFMNTHPEPVNTNTTVGMSQETTVLYSDENKQRAFYNQPETIPISHKVQADTKVTEMVSPSIDNEIEKNVMESPVLMTRTAYRLPPQQAEQVLSHLTRQQVFEKERFSRNMQMLQRKQQNLKTQINTITEPAERRRLINLYAQGEAELNQTDGQWNRRQIDTNRRLQQMRENVAQLSPASQYDNR